MREHKHGGADCREACCLRVEGLTVRSGDYTILEDVHVHVHCGEILTLVGPNGAGKTTLLRAILGQRDYQQGTIRFERGSHGQQRPVIGYVPQTPHFEPGDPVTVLDLFSMYLRRAPAFLPPGKRFRERVKELLSRVDADHLLDSRMGRLSGGEMQRVLLALALEPAPHILILDEPVSGVDLAGKRLFYQELSALRENYDLSVILITHDYDMIRQYADRVLLLDRRVLAEGTPDQVLTSRQFKEAFHLTEGGED